MCVTGVGLGRDEAGGGVVAGTREIVLADVKDESNQKEKVVAMRV